MWRQVTGWFGAQRRIVRALPWLDDRVWGGSVLFLIPAMPLSAWLAVIAGTLTAAVGIGSQAGAFLALALAWPAVPAMHAAGSIFVERMWATFFICRLFRVQGRPIRAGWERCAGVGPAAGEAPDRVRGGEAP